jgi:aryl-alcohol dehydrogenase-like predicted oxidoreductase
MGNVSGMEQRSIGGLSVSVVGLGCNQLGTRACAEPTATEVVREALDAGITIFDVADEYGSNYADPTDLEGWGRSEEILGKALGPDRDRVIIASKFGIRRHGHPEQGGGSARWANTAIEDSLRRLGTDYIDLYQLHYPDPDVPIEETLGALDEIAAQGKVREIGCCNMSGAQLSEAAVVARDEGLRSFVSSQNLLNLFQRAAETEVLPACQELGLAFIPYYPLASGMLTGKYRRGEPVPTGSRMSEQVGEEARRKLLSDRTFGRLEALESYADARDHSLLELAFAWLLGHPNVATVIAGAARAGQASSNAVSGGWTLSPEEVTEVTRLVESIT